MDRQAPVTVGDVIFSLRERHQRPQPQVAQALRWSQAKLSRIETNSRMPNARDLERLLTELQATPEDRAKVRTALLRVP